MEKKFENKAIKPEVTKKEAFSFPEHGMSIVATSQEEAQAMLKEKLADKE